MVSRQVGEKRSAWWCPTHSRLDDIFRARLTPRDSSGILLLVDRNLVTVDGQVTSLLAWASFVVGSDRDLALKGTMDRIVLKHIHLGREGRDMNWCKGTAV